MIIVTVTIHVRPSIFESTFIVACIWRTAPRSRRQLLKTLATDTRPNELSDENCSSNSYLIEIRVRCFCLRRYHVIVEEVNMLLDAIVRSVERTKYFVNILHG